ncbi:unnamed protein product, partial [Closterium sp. Naga37s-1]
FQVATTKAKRAFTDLRRDAPPSEAPIPSSLPTSPPTPPQPSHGWGYPWLLKASPKTSHSEELSRRVAELSKEPQKFLMVGVSDDRAEHYVNLESALLSAPAILEADDHLSRIFSEFVPRLVSEREFWKRYFYVVAKVELELEHEEDWGAADPSPLGSPASVGSHGRLFSLPMWHPKERDMNGSTCSTTTSVCSFGGNVDPPNIPSSVLLRNLAQAVSYSAPFATLKDLVAHNGKWPGTALAQAVGAGIGRAFSLSSISNVNDIDTTDDMIQRLLSSGEEAAFDCSCDTFSGSSSGGSGTSNGKPPQEKPSDAAPLAATALVHSVHGAYPDSFVAQVAALMAELPSEKDMAQLWLALVEQLRVRWKQGVPVPHVAAGRHGPDLRLCEVMQHLQLLNCCIARQRRRKTIGFACKLPGSAAAGTGPGGGVVGRGGSRKIRESLSEGAAGFAVAAGAAGVGRPSSSNVRAVLSEGADCGSDMAAASTDGSEPCDASKGAVAAGRSARDVCLGGAEEQSRAEETLEAQWADTETLNRSSEATCTVPEAGGNAGMESCDRIMNSSEEPPFYTAARGGAGGAGDDSCGADDDLAAGPCWNRDCPGQHLFLCDTCSLPCGNHPPVEHTGQVSPGAAPGAAAAEYHLDACYARVQSGRRVLRRGVKEQSKSLRLLETGEPLCIPVTQDGPLMTESSVRESEELIMRTKSFGTGHKQLFSDMQSFKAANPGCVLEDFVRWYSPPDWSPLPQSPSVHSPSPHTPSAKPPTVQTPTLDSASLPSPTSHTRELASEAKTPCAATCAASCAATCAASCAATCAASCAATCAASCAATCAASCAATCAASCAATCAASCAATCAASCAATCAASCAATCAASCAATCAASCAATCAASCAATCAASCAATCAASCAATCAASCAATCAASCAATCAASCAATCAASCAATCAASCAATCAASCAATCAASCAATCAASCAATCAASCAATCAASCAATCAASCAATCAASCAATCAASCAATCAASCAATCAASCAATCAASCAATCAASCAATCAASCAASHGREKLGQAAGSAAGGRIDSTPKKTGYLSVRMKASDNLWQQLWNRARPLPIALQPPLVDYDYAAEKSLTWLESIPPSHLFAELFTALVVAGFSAAASAYHTPPTTSSSSSLPARRQDGWVRVNGSDVAAAAAWKQDGEEEEEGEGEGEGEGEEEGEEEGEGEACVQATANGHIRARVAECCRYVAGACTRGMSDDKITNVCLVYEMMEDIVVGPQAKAQLPRANTSASQDAQPVSTLKPSLLQQWQQWHSKPSAKPHDNHQYPPGDAHPIDPLPENALLSNPQPNDRHDNDTHQNDKEDDNHACSDSEPYDTRSLSDASCGTGGFSPEPSTSPRIHPPANTPARRFSILGAGSSFPSFPTASFPTSPMFGSIDLSSLHQYNQQQQPPQQQQQQQQQTIQQVVEEGSADLRFLPHPLRQAATVAVSGMPASQQL